MKRWLPFLLALQFTLSAFGNVRLTYTRGLDLSGSLQGAGGIGGLLAMTDGSGANYFYHQDGMGNVTALIDVYENIVGRREYDAWGRTINLTGSKAGINPFWFSSQLHDEDTDIYSYLYRPYTPNPPRWPNQDPIGESGGLNLYRFNRNNPLSYVDPTGRAPQLVGVTYDFTMGQSTAQYQPYQFGQGYGIGLHTPPFDPFSAIANDLDRAWNYGLDQITPPLNPNTDPYAYAASQTAREVALNALLIAATDRVGKIGGTRPVKCPTKFPKSFLNANYPRYDYPKWWKNELWERSIDPKTGKVFDVSGKVIDPGVNWEVGHQGMTFAESQQWAAENGLSYDQWYDMEHNFSNFRPELPSSNASHAYENWLPLSSP